MTIDAEAIFRRWIELYDAGEPAQALALTSPQFAMLAPGGKHLDRDSALQIALQMKAYLEGQQLSRKTRVLSLHVVPVVEGHAVVHAQIEVTLSKAAQDSTSLRFSEVIHVGPEGISFDSICRLSDSQTLF